MKKLFLFIGISVVILFCCKLISWAFVEFFFAEPTIMQSIKSPDGKYTAYVFESNGGATSGWVYHISVLRNGKKLSKGNGNIYTSESEPGNVEWLDNTTLYVEDWNNPITKRKEKIYDVTVKFRGLELKRQKNALKTSI